MNVLVVDNGSSYLDKLLNLFGNAKTEVVQFNSMPEEKDFYDLVVLSGGHVFDLEENKKLYEAEIRLIQNSRMPILGICLGSEIIVKAFGGEVRSLDHLEKGVMSVNVIKDDLLFKNIKPLFEVYENHRKVIDKLPECLELLAESVDGIEIFKHRDRFIYGIQFHPEMFKEIGVNSVLVDNLLGLIRK